MSTVTTSPIVCSSSDATEQFGSRLGLKLKGGETIELVSDLGGGKTTLTRGIARGAGSQDHVSSPTFKINNTYHGKNLTLQHYDFYRLKDAGLMEHEIRETLDDPNAVVIVEWGDAVQHVLPQDRLTINIRKTADDKRELTCAYAPSLAYLLEEA